MSDYGSGVSHHYMQLIMNDDMPVNTDKPLGLTEAIKLGYSLRHKFFVKASPRHHQRLRCGHVDCERINSYSPADCTVS
jgi:hypothetical protein